jgi:flagellar hook-length control protein FliK
MLPNQIIVTEPRVTNESQTQNRVRSNSENSNREQQDKEQFQRSMQESMQHQKQQHDARTENRSEKVTTNSTSQVRDNDSQASKQNPLEPSADKRAGDAASEPQNSNTNEEKATKSQSDSHDCDTSDESNNSEVNAELKSVKPINFNPELSATTFDEAMQQLLAQKELLGESELSQVDFDVELAKLKESGHVQFMLKESVNKSETEQEVDTDEIKESGLSTSDESKTPWLDDVLAIAASNKEMSNDESFAEITIKETSNTEEQVDESQLNVKPDTLAWLSNLVTPEKTEMENVDSETLDSEALSKVEISKPESISLPSTNSIVLSQLSKQISDEQSESDIKQTIQTDSEKRTDTVSANLSILDRMKASRMQAISFASEDKNALSTNVQNGKEELNAEQEFDALIQQVVSKSGEERVKANAAGEHTSTKVSQVEALAQILGDSKVTSGGENQEKSTYVDVAGVEINRTLQAAKVENIHTNRTEAVLRENILFNKQEMANFANQQIGLMLARNLKSIDIRLDPPELGSMQIKMSVTNDQASVSFIVGNQQAKEALENSLPKLKELFEQGGMQLADSDVQQQDNQQASAEGDADGSANGRSGVQLDDAEQDTDMPHVKQVVNVKSPWSVDYFA